jgi:CheY-like chemotaxis protein
VCRDGRDVTLAVTQRTPDVAVLDLQVGSMGAMAVTMNLRLDESGGRLPHIPVVMLLDRIADVHLARRSGAEGWLVKPIDSLRLRRAVKEVCSGGVWHESVPPAMQHS